MWATGFSAAGRIVRPSVLHWSSTGGQRILVVAPHPDDEVLGCAGVIARHSATGDQVMVLHVTDGRQSRALGLSPESMAECRQREAKNATHILGAQLEWLGLPEGGWSSESLIERLENVLKRWCPDIVYGPSVVDFHPDHVRVAHVLVRIIENASALNSQSCIRVYQSQTPLTPVLCNLVADASAQVAEIEAAVCAYVSQKGSVLLSLRMRRYAACFYGYDRYAEEFCQVDAAQYCRLNETASLQTHPHSYRGLRVRSLSDPLAYVRGLAERRRVANAIGLQQSYDLVQ